MSRMRPRFNFSQKNCINSPRSVIRTFDCVRLRWAPICCTYALYTCYPKKSCVVCRLQFLFVLPYLHTPLVGDEAILAAACAVAGIVGPHALLRSPLHYDSPCFRCAYHVVSRELNPDAPIHSGPRQWKSALRAQVLALLALGRPLASCGGLSPLRFQVFARHGIVSACIRYFQEKTIRLCAKSLLKSL